MRPVRLACFACLLVLAASCRDRSVGPPPHHLDARGRAIVAAHTVAAPPPHLLEPPGGPVTLGGGRIEYLGMDVVPRPAVRAGAVTATFYWRARRKLDHDWKVFVHVSEPGRSGLLLNADGWPIAGLWPTSRFVPGKIYADPHSFTLPRGYPDPRVDIHVGLYRVEGRMPVDRRSAQDGANRIRAGTVKVAGGTLPLPVYRAPFTSVAPVIDGKLDDAVWKAAPMVLLTRSDGRGAPSLRTEARLLWDDTHLYVAFRVEDPDVWSDFKKDDDPLYKEEVVEVFLDADGDGRTYNELELAPSGHVFDARFEAPRQGMDLAWSSKMKVGVKVDGTLNDASDTDRGWTAEMAIPFATLYHVPHIPPRPGDTWRFDLYRLEHPHRTSEEGMAFSPPVIPDFHNVRRFARLVFEGATPAAAPAKTPAH